MAIKADYDFNGSNIPFSFSMGEIKWLNFEFQGYKCRCDIFASPAIDAPSPPWKEMKDSGYKLAYEISQPVAKKLRMLYFRDGYICYVVRHYKHYFISTVANFDDYLKSFKAKTRATLLRKVKKANAANSQGNFFRVFSSSDEINEFLPVAHAVSKKSFQYIMLKQGLPDNERYTNDFIHRAKESRIFGFLLYINNKPAAYNLCPVYGGDTMTYYYTGYDPEFSDYSPGSVLQFKTIEFACNIKQINQYDLCIGEGGHKELFSDEFKYCADVYYFPITGKYMLLVSLSIVHRLAMGLIKLVISSLANPVRLRRWVRGIMMPKRHEKPEDNHLHEAA